MNLGARRPQWSNKLTNCWFAPDVRAVMLVVKNKSVSLLWQLNSIFMQVLREKLCCFGRPIWPPCHVVANQDIITIVRQTEPKMVCNNCSPKCQIHH